jgi:hypothetical protein
MTESLLLRDLSRTITAVNNIPIMTTRAMMKPAIVFKHQKGLQRALQNKLIENQYETLLKIKSLFRLGVHLSGIAW